MDTKLSEWEVIEPEIERNKSLRVNWVLIYGRSLSKEISDCYCKGWNWEQTYNHLLRCLDCENKNFNKLSKLLKNNVCSLYCKKKV